MTVKMLKANTANKLAERRSIRNVNCVFIIIDLDEKFEKKCGL
jgi:hypothetical protein